MLLQYLQYLLKSKKKGRKIHSPFFRNFAIKVLNDFGNHNLFFEIEKIRFDLLRNHQKIKVVDLGAGSKKKFDEQKKVSKIAKYSLTSPKYCRLLHRIANFTKTQYILELGTSLGITTLYFNQNENVKKITTIEGANSISKIAQENFNKFDSKINLITDNFDNILPQFIKKNTKFDLIFVDGNHTKQATLRYFFILKNLISETGIIIFDDIRWSKGMFEAWEIIKNSSDYSTVDLFKIGIVFFDSNLKEKQDLQLFY